MWIVGLNPLTCTVDISASSRNIWIMVWTEDIKSGTLYNSQSSVYPIILKTYSGLSNARVPKLTAVFKVLASASKARIRRYFTDVARTWPGTKAPTNPGAANRKTMERRKPRHDWIVMRVYVSDSLWTSSSAVSRVGSPHPMVDLFTSNKHE